MCGSSSLTAAWPSTTARFRAVLGALLLAVTTGACLVGPNYSRPAIEQPPAFKSEPPGSPAKLPESAWWQLYGDPELERLIAAANASNQTIRQAVARVDEARALARVAGSYLYPSVSANPSF
jgi:outer membrane protein TolC